MESILLSKIKINSQYRSINTNVYKLVARSKVIIRKINKKIVQNKNAIITLITILPITQIITLLSMTQIITITLIFIIIITQIIINLNK